HGIPSELGRRLAEEVPACRRRINRANDAAMRHRERRRTELAEPASHAGEHFARAFATHRAEVPAARLVLCHLGAELGAQLFEAPALPCPPAHLGKARLSF